MTQKTTDLIQRLELLLNNESKSQLWGYQIVRVALKDNNYIIYGDFGNIFKELAQNTNNIASIKYLIIIKPDTFSHFLNTLQFKQNFTSTFW